MFRCLPDAAGGKDQMSGAGRIAVVAGASGLVGRALVAALRAEGWAVRCLVRRPPARAGEFPWDPAAGTIDAAALAGAHAVINLAGENIAAGRWTAVRRERILRSRVEATRTLVLALQAMSERPAVLLNASAVGFYGDRGDEVLTERSGLGVGFLTEVTLAWETHADGAARAGVRTVLLRFGMVLAEAGGALGKMLPPFRLGLGGPLGRGRQWTSWIGIDDAIGAMLHALRDTRVSGPVNVVAPEPVTNAQFAAALGRAVGRPAVLPAPAWALRLLFGAMADEMLLASTRAVPRELERTGYRFRHPTLEVALRAVLAKPAATAG